VRHGNGGFRPLTGKIGSSGANIRWRTDTLQ
jgi:hypothetical protein